MFIFPKLPFNSQRTTLARRISTRLWLRVWILQRPCADVSHLPNLMKPLRSDILWGYQHLRNFPVSFQDQNTGRKFGPNVNDTCCVWLCGWLEYIQLHFYQDSLACHDLWHFKLVKSSAPKFKMIIHPSEPELDCEHRKKTGRIFGCNKQFGQVWFPPKFGGLRKRTFPPVRCFFFGAICGIYCR